MRHIFRHRVQRQVQNPDQQDRPDGENGHEIEQSVAAVRTRDEGRQMFGCQGIHLRDSHWEKYYFGFR
jgi:hypothetical protein